MSEKAKSLVVVLGGVTALGAAAIDMYLPALPRIAIDLASTSGHAQLTLGAFLVGLGIGQLIHGALSDAYGRRRLLLCGIVLYCAASLGCTTATDIDTLIVWRFVQALGAAAGSVIVRAIVRDLYSMDEGARAQSFINMAFLVTPLLAPNVGGYLLTWFGWRSIFIVMSLFGAVCLVALSFRLPESLPAERRTSLSLTKLLTGYAQILTDRQTLGCLLAGTFSFACMFTFFAGSPFVYITYFGVPEQHYGLLFALNVIGIISTNYLNARLVLAVGAIRLLCIGCAVCATSGLVLAATTYFAIGGLWGVVVPLVFVVGSLGFVGANALAGAMEPFANRAATTASLFGFSRMLVGAGAGAVLALIHDGTPVPMGYLVAALGLLSLLSCLMLRSATTRVKPTN